MAGQDIQHSRKSPPPSDLTRGTARMRRHRPSRSSGAGLGKGSRYANLIISIWPVVTRSPHAGVLPEQVFCDGWSIGYDDRFPHSQRIQQAFVYARLGEHENLYAHPMVSANYLLPRCHSNNYSGLCSCCRLQFGESDPHRYITFISAFETTSD